MSIIKIALFGLGNAAMAFLEILSDKQHEGQFPHPVGISAIATGSRGLWRFEGQELTPQALLRHLQGGGVLRDLPGAVAFEGTSVELADVADYNVLLELSPLNIHTGQPAIAHIEGALIRGLGAITANKGPLAWDYKRLKALAKEHHTTFLYETTVMDGTPIFNLVEDTLPSCRVLAIEGILNTTTNFILEEMAKGVDTATIMAEGKRRGFVEADPSMDIDGHDAAAKLCALANVLMDAELTPADVRRQGIAHITPGDIAVAKQLGAVIKLMCRATKGTEGSVNAVVAPEQVSAHSLYATVDATSSAISITTDLMGKLTIFEHAPEIQQTGYGIYQDLVRFVRTNKR